MAPLLNKPAIQVVAALLRNSHGEVLLGQRAASADHPHLWEFPGGKVEEHETQREPLSRELREELGIQTDPRTFFLIHRLQYDYPTKSVNLSLYAVPTWSDEPNALIHQDIRWVSPDQIKDNQYPMPAANVGFIEKILEI